MRTKDILNTGLDIATKPLTWISIGTLFFATGCGHDSKPSQNLPDNNQTVTLPFNPVSPRPNEFYFPEIITPGGSSAVSTAEMLPVSTIEPAAEELPIAPVSTHPAK